MRAIQALTKAAALIGVGRSPRSGWRSDLHLGTLAAQPKVGWGARQFPTGGLV